MQHIDQHTLELYALCAPSVAGRTPEIEAHLAACDGCKQLVARMLEAYGHTEELVQELNQQATGPADSLPVVRPRTAVAGAAGRMASASLRPPSRMERAQYFMRRHPAVTGAGSFMALAGLLLAANLIFRSPAVTNVNPAFVRYNENTNAAEILDRNYKYLWQIPTRFVAALQLIGGRQGELKTVVRDIDGDGWNEVVTTLWHPGTIPDGDNSSMRVYEHNGSIRLSKSFEGHVSYLNRKYEDNWSVCFCAVAGDTMQAKNLYVTWNSGRSPEVLTRLAADGAELGQYWHFGNINGMYPLENGESFSRGLLLVGIDDAEDSLDTSVPFAAVLDPSKLNGVGKSSGSGGFNMAESRAEDLYIRFPSSPLAKALSQNSYASYASRNGNGTLSVWVASGRPVTDGKIDQYEYIFAPDMHLLQVKSTSMTDLLYLRKAKEGLVKGRIDAAYLAKLKDGVRYWDGEKWVKEATRIRRALAAVH
jgi:hypothetical protein